MHYNRSKSVSVVSLQAKAITVKSGLVINITTLADTFTPRTLSVLTLFITSVLVNKYS